MLASNLRGEPSLTYRRWVTSECLCDPLMPPVTRRVGRLAIHFTIILYAVRFGGYRTLLERAGANHACCTGVSPAEVPDLFLA